MSISPDARLKLKATEVVGNESEVERSLHGKALKAIVVKVFGCACARSNVGDGDYVLRHSIGECVYFNRMSLVVWVTQQLPKE